MLPRRELFFLTFSCHEQHERRTVQPHTILHNSSLFDDTFLPDRRGAKPQATQNEAFSIEPEQALVDIERQELLQLCQLDFCRYRAKVAHPRAHEQVATEGSVPIGSVATIY